ncbi:anti-virulence regulator CigR family protein [Rheinheimera marina]|uniref:Anti-virulence regulator CigR family protein n=1 Tax=Rheinheimera marina TaxID=1774958 RepID=A0ABV9JMR5_9GAMM
MNNRHKLWALLIVPMLTAPALAGPDKDKGNDKSQEKQQAQQWEKSAKAKHKEYSPALVGGGLAQADARKLAVEFQLVGQQDLPAGIRKNLTKGKPLPPGIQKKAVPAEFVSRLPVHQGYEWRLVGTDLILVSVATQVVADVLHDVFR